MERTLFLEAYGTMTNVAVVERFRMKLGESWGWGEGVRIETPGGGG